MAPNATNGDREQDEQDGRRERPRADTGEFADSIDATDALVAFRELDDRSEPLGASEVADAMGAARRTAFNKLDTLSEAGILNSKKVGQARVWWVNDHNALDHADADADAQDEQDRDRADDPETDGGSELSVADALDADQQAEQDALDAYDEQDQQDAFADAFADGADSADETLVRLDPDAVPADEQDGGSNT